MSVKRYGIYLAFPPTIKLSTQGLGRHLAAFLKEASNRNDTRFTVVCPSWTKADLKKLFKEEGIPDEADIEIITPKRIPMVLALYQKLLAYKNWKKTRPQKSRFILKKLKKLKNTYRQYLLQNLIAIDSVFSFIFRSPIIIALLLLAIITMPLWLVGWVCLAIVRIFQKLTLAIRKTRNLINHYEVKILEHDSGDPNSSITRLLKSPLGILIKGYYNYRRKITLSSASKKLQNALDDPKSSNTVSSMYSIMERRETRRMQNIINKLTDIHCWYCPTAFWPTFNDIKAPRLMCVPDVVPVEFAIGFTQVKNNGRIIKQFKILESAINGGSHFVTYSNNVKWSTLVDRYLIKPQDINVIPHAANKLNKWVDIQGTQDDQASSIKFCQRLSLKVLKKSDNGAYIDNLQNDQLKFFFYASQLRPNKNVLTLLKAYKYLLRKRFIGHKLIMTCDDRQISDVRKFIHGNSLEKDILLVYGLNIQELAAFYKLADLAVNPSLSEGGCPFTFTEALSVDTPVVMSRIAVTEEVLTNPKLQDMMLFNPYDWRDMANRIEWALRNREQLLNVQRKTYSQLAKRTWSDVVNDYLAVMENIGNQ